ncbi:hypothetical protein DCS_01907 [Drechmeria coniospora]|uniref:Uncharacterized protein n=1 Tax=Drechmeria coniospora TaxID=98403 RepID=A0A151GUI0_DRECN|nr:hypothetical protein DCS_01907 [Drechmeria coniospora]KYK60769.1 hypothetical protein DCS_01907 [Drechmeria coniospora]ODA83458.1 hypothetical protein RJ55_01972 [Drechmeria coniospora]
MTAPDRYAQQYRTTTPSSSLDVHSKSDVESVPIPTPYVNLDGRLLTAVDRIRASADPRPATSTFMLPHDAPGGIQWWIDTAGASVVDLCLLHLPPLRGGPPPAPNFDKEITLEDDKPRPDDQTGRDDRGESAKNGGSAAGKRQRR